MRSTTMRCFSLFLLAMLAACARAPGAAQVPSAPETVLALPAHFEEHRIYVRPVTADGDTLVFYTDTGGGANMIYTPAVERLELPRELTIEDGDTTVFVGWPTWAAGAKIPPPSPEGYLGGRLLVVPFTGHAASLQDSADAGFLGRLWFADRVWTFDYPGQQLLLRPAGDLPPHRPEHRVSLGFQIDSAGQRTTHFPRIRVAVAGDSLDLLFDTGATTVLTDSALAVIRDGGIARRATSFIAASVFDRWRAEHPEWRVIEAAESYSGAAMIEVPRLRIADYTVGPVWFTRRPDTAFLEYMSQWMDESVVGALGSNALRFFRVTVDYPDATAISERP